MKTKLTVFLLTLTFLFLFSSSPVLFADDVQDAKDAYERADYETAYKLFLPLAEQGDAKAQYFLGMMHSEGKGVPQDYQDAVKWYLLAAEQGKASAQYDLGIMYKKGLGVLQDYKEAVKWSRLAVKQGHAPTQFNLGVMHYEGRGVPQDYVLAHMWFNLSGSNGSKSGVENKHWAEKKMTKQQIEKAQEMAINWKPKK